MPRVAKTGNEAAAEALRQIAPDVVAAYPITPSTEVVQIFSEYVAAGLVDCEFVAAESEHSAMSICIGAAACGARAATATSAQGLALMWEMLYIASGFRLPIVLIVVNRTLSSPINIHCDHSDSMGARDSGWIQLYSENVQQVYDNIIQAVVIAERTRLPVMVNYDGFIISHGMEVVDLIDDKEVEEFVGEYNPKVSLLKEKVTQGAIDFTDYFFEHKRSQIEAMQLADITIKAVTDEFSAKFGRKYNKDFEVYNPGGRICLVILGSTVGTARVALKDYPHISILSLRTFRPFPYKSLGEVLSKYEVVGVLERADGVSGFGGILFHEIRSALYSYPNRPKVMNFICGLGGRDIDTSQIIYIKECLENPEKMKKEIEYVGVRDGS